MKKMTNYFYSLNLIVLLFLHITSNGSDKCVVTVFIDRYENAYTVHHNQDTFKINNERYFTIEKIGCNGSVILREYLSRSNKKVLEGNYIANRDTTIIVKVLVDEFDMTTKMDTLTYFIPNKDGLWIYYDEMGNVSKSEKYINGLLR